MGITGNSATNDGPVRPRVLAIGLTPEEVEAIKPLAGSLREAPSWHTVHPEEHDVLIHTSANFNDHAGLFSRRIVFAKPAEPMESMRSIAFASGISGGNAIREPTKTQTQFRPASHFDISEEARDLGMAGLVQRSCMPEVGTTYTGFRTSVYPERDEHVLLWERLNRPLALAAILEDPGDKRPVDSAFWLPDIARDEIQEWVRVAFDRWRTYEPEVFPQTAEWRRANEWSAPAEIEARGHLEAFDEKEALRRAEADAERAKLVIAAEATQDDGERWRALVSESGDDLVVAVQEAFEFIGFSVVNADGLDHHKGKKREDLRVRDDAWTALVEVKGYSGAAKSNDLQQLTAAAAVYAATERSVPDALWYVVNAHRELDPAQRALPLAGRDEDLEAFADNHNGCLIDARDLFALRQQVALGQLDAASARHALKGASARARIARIADARNTG